MILLSRALSRESTLASVLVRGLLYDNIGRIAQVRWSEAKPNLHGGVEFNREQIAQVRWSEAKPNLRGGVNVAKDE